MGALVGGIYADDSLGPFKEWMLSLDKRKVFNLMTYHMAQMSLKYFTPDVLIEVSRDSCGTYDFFKAEELVDMGCDATIKALDNMEA